MRVRILEYRFPFSGQKLTSIGLSQTAMKPEKHYHIRWSNSDIDWKPFRNSEDASDLAEVIKKRNESYTILERDSECERCKAFTASARN